MVFNNPLVTIETNYRKSCVVLEKTVPIDSKMQISALSEVCNLVTDGTHDTPKTLKNGVPFIKAKEIVGGIIDFENCEYITYEDHLKVISRSNPEKGDILFAHIGASLGEAAFIKTDKEFSIKNVALFKPNPFKIDNRYLFYYVISSKFQNEVKNCRTGSAQPFVSLEFLRNHPIEYHTNLGTQRKIAAILSAYDDLIENNTRRIKILEEMAQALYREWFVKFLFPGHEKVKMVESELGMVPEGWEIKKATDAIYVNPTTKVPKEGEKPFVSMGNLSNDSMFVNSFEYRSGNSGSKFKNADTLFARITPCLENGKTAYVQFLPFDDDVAFGSTEFIVLRSKTLSSELVYLMALSNEFRDNAIKSMSGATGRQRVQEACFDKFLLAHPDPKTISAFAEHISPLFQDAYILNKKNVNLRRIRDLLLPKLISGELNIENLDIVTTKERK